MNQTDRHNHRKKVQKDRREKLKKRLDKEVPMSKEEWKKIDDAVDRDKD